MGFKISWIGLEGTDRATCLEWLQMTDTLRVDEANEASFSFAQLPTGWSVLFANDFEYASEKRLLELSKNTRMICCHIHEGIMYSSAASFVSGQQVWSVTHDSGKGYAHLLAAGRLPDAFEDIHQRLKSEQAANGGKDSDTDYIFDCPVELASICTGYRHDRWEFDWGQPEFTEVVPLIAAKKNWWQKLFN